MEEINKDQFDVIDFIRKWGIYGMVITIAYLANDKWETAQKQTEYVQTHQEQHLQQLDIRNEKSDAELQQIKEDVHLILYQLKIKRKDIE